MLTITYETLYASDKEYVVILQSDRYPEQSRRVRLMCPGDQYFAQIGSVLKKRGFSFRVIDER